MINLHHVARFRYKPIQPYDFVLTVKKPAGWSWFTPYEIWERGTIWSGFWREISVRNKKRKIPIGIKARYSKGAVVAELYSNEALPKDELLRLKNLIGKSLGVSEDLKPFYKLMQKHRILKTLVKRHYGMHEGWGMNIFSSLTLAILLQMAPIKRSEQMWHCLIESYGKKISFDGKSVLLWPTEDVVAKLNPSAAAKKCKLGYRAKFLVRMSRQLIKGFPTIEELADMTPEEANEKLLTLYGVGGYTASFASPHPSFSLDVWSIKIFYPILFGKRAPKKDPRSMIDKAIHESERLWGEWRNYVLVYVLNDLPYLSKKFKIPVE